MIKYISNTGGGKTVDFEKAILDGFAVDGGLYVLETLPQIPLEILQSWKGLSYQDLAFEVLSLFIEDSVVPKEDLKGILQTAYAPFEKEEVIPLRPLKSRKDTYIMELFHGPTLSFKDVGMAFIVNLFNYFLKRKGECLSLVTVTTGDTGPAAAYFAAGKSNLDAWILYPKGLITPEQERQMTTLPHPNIHPVGVFGCPEGADDLDLAVAKMYANTAFKEKLQLSSVNSFNWGRILIQTVHYFYGYLQVVEKVGEAVNMSVPSGGFGNLCAGGLARKMGLPVKYFVVANNRNNSLNRIFNTGIFSKAPLYETPASAIDILIPYNFWRYLYFCEGVTPKQIKEWQETFRATGEMVFDKAIFEAYSKGFLAHTSSDEDTLALIQLVFEAENYLLDPHAAVALQAAGVLKDKIGGEKMICLATAHPSKFSKVILKALQ
ncbi:MAG: threonine synthase, partial [Chitinophagales bacterium]